MIKKKQKHILQKKLFETKPRKTILPSLVKVYTGNSALHRLRQEDREFNASLGYIVSFRSTWII
jgi:hypothetical protein